jgi:glucosamine--fructose-6-phosphate aminotransferase (isomerizing)
MAVESITVTRALGSWSDTNATGSRLAIGRAAGPGHDAQPYSRPLADCRGGVMVVHCGTIDNAADLRAALEAGGHRFRSPDDAEVIPHAIEHELNHGAGAFEAFQAAVQRLSGSWAIVCLIARHNSIFVARYRSPLLVRGTVGRCIVATDPAATDGVRGPLRVLEDGSIAELGTMWRWAGTPGRPPAPTPAADISRLMAPGPTDTGDRRRGTLQHH